MSVFADGLVLMVPVLVAIDVNPAKLLAVPPKETLVEPIVTDELVRLELPMLLNVLLAPEIVLLVSVCVPLLVVTVESIAIVPDDVIVPPDKPVPAVILVTVPPDDGLVFVTVNTPSDDLPIEIPVPAVKSVFFQYPLVPP